MDRTIIHNGLNRGYPAAINQGLAVAKGDTICLLNNDTEVTAGWLDPMLMVLRGGYGMVGPCSDNVSGEQGSGGFGVMGVGDPNAIVYYDASRLVGFCLLMKRAVLDKIGGLDERFGIGNFDDDDYCIRAQLAGFYLAIVRNSFVHHVGGATFRAEGIDYQKLLVENWVKFQDKWGVPAHVPMGAPYILMADPDTNLYIPLPVLA